MNIVQICADRGIAPGSTKGAAQHLRGIAGGLASLGHRVVTYAARPPEGPFPVEVRPLADLTAAAIDDADIIYERYALGHRDGLDLARAVGTRFVLEVNAPLVDEAMAHRADTVTSDDVLIESSLLADADLVIAVSTDLAAWVDQSRNRPTVSVSNGFEPDWFPAAARPETVPDRLVFLGHPKPWHGADRLPRLLVDLRIYNLAPELLIIGGGPGADRLRTEAHRLGVQDQVFVTGALPPRQASALLADATIGLAPYPRQEPFYFCPLKVIDYLAAGLPIVSTDQGDIGRLVRQCGVLVDPEDDKALTAAIARLLANPARRAALGAAGRTRAMATLTWQHVASLTEAAITTSLFAELVESAG